MTKFFTFLKQKRLELTESIKGRTVIYLDLNYWIRLRNAQLGGQGADTTFLHTVQDLYDTGTCIFPISEMTFWEIMKQADLDSRAATIALVDRLSGGLALIDMRERAALETRIWLSKQKGLEVHESNELVWTNLTLAIGHEMLMSLPTEDMACLALEDLAAMSLTEATKHITAVFAYKDNVALFNQSFEDYAHHYMTRDELMAIETDGIVDANRAVITDAVESMHHRDTGKNLTDAERKADRTPERVMDAFRSGNITTELPLFHIIASLHTWTRWTKKPFKDGNDTMDIYHASFALPYADYFFTDRRLANGIRQCKLDTLYKCLTEHDPAQALRALQNLQLAKVRNNA